MSESANDVSEKKTETSSSSESESESESESDSSEKASEATPKAASGDEAKVEGDAGVTKSTTSEASKSEEESAATAEPPPPPTKVADEKVITSAGSEASEESSATLHSESEPPDAPAAAPSDTDVEHPVAARTPQSTIEKTEAPPSDEVRVEKVARVVGQAKSDVIDKPEVTENASEVYHVYQRTIVQQTQV